jgi:hypothetical protein
MLPLLVPVLFTFYIQGVLKKLKKFRCQKINIRIALYRGILCVSVVFPLAHVVLRDIFYTLVHCLFKLPGYIQSTNLDYLTFHVTEIYIGLL